MLIELVPVAMIDDLWPRVKDIVALTDDAVLNSEDVLNYLQTGQWRLWVALEDGKIVAAMTVEFFYYPRDKVCRVVTLGGKMMKGWLTDNHQQAVENWAKGQGCSYIDVYGRKGWKKVLPEYKEDCILLRKKL